MSCCRNEAKKIRSFRDRERGPFDCASHISSVNLRHRSGLLRECAKGLAVVRRRHLGHDGGSCQGYYHSPLRRRLCVGTVRCQLRSYTYPEHGRDKAMSRRCLQDLLEEMLYEVPENGSLSFIIDDFCDIAG